MTPHLCHANGCHTAVRPALFMCKPHWFALPKALRDAVWAAYEPGQEDRKDPSPAYLEAAHAALDFLQAKAEAKAAQNALPLENT